LRHAPPGRPSFFQPAGRFCVSVHHYSLQKRHAGWKKEGRPGGACRNPGYIFRYTRAELAALFPGARIRAMGFYGLPAQRLISRTAGHLLARLGRGHMLSAYGRAH